MIIHLPGLNGIRALAALLVLFSHLHQYKNWFGFDPSPETTELAAYGVTLFFVLSGYLITYLLLCEKEQFKSVSIRKFYIRRILRIWPLYYLIVLIGLLLLSSDQAIIYLPYYLLLFPNLAFVLGHASVLLAPLWSIGVEEQFYALWPWLVRLTSRIHLVLIGVIGTYLIFKFILWQLEYWIAYEFISLTRIDCMAIGGLGAWWALGERKMEGLIFNRFFQVVIWIVFLFSCFIGPPYIFDFINQELHSALFVLLIVNVSLNTRSIVDLERKMFDWLGKISYGIYLWHMPVILFLSKILADGIPNSYPGFIAYGLIVVVSVIVVSGLSYRYFEGYFMKLKTRFSVIESRDSRFVK